MARSSQRVLKRLGRVALIETADPAMGVGYSVRIGTLGLWSGDSLAEAKSNSTRQPVLPRHRRKPAIPNNRSCCAAS
jgi:hypothetical protein